MYGVQGTTSHLPHPQRTPSRGCGMVHTYKLTMKICVECGHRAQNLARLFAAATSESDSWLNALPVLSLGLCTDVDVVRIAVPPPCLPACGPPMDEQAIHGLSCVRRAGRQSCHAAINDVVKRALSLAQIPSTLEPTGLSRSDSKRPDGVTIAPWKSGRMLAFPAQTLPPHPV